MDRFAPALRRVARELELPPPVRAAILLEMAADLEAIFEEHRRRGATEEEAARRAEQTVLGSSEMIRRLGRVHQRSWRGWSERVGARLSHGVDLMLLILAVLPMLAGAAVVAARMVATSGGVLVWMLIVLGVFLVGIVAAEARRQARGVGGRPRSLAVILVLSAMAPAVGGLALALGVYAASMQLSTAGSDASGQLLFATTVARDGSSLLLGLLLGIAGALSWFILLHRSSTQLVREVESLLNSTSLITPGGRAEGVLPLVRGRSA